MGLKVARWSNEIDLLLACARTRLEQRDVARAERAFRAGVDWDRVIEYGRAHRLLPLLGLHAARLGMPAAMHQALNERCRSSALRGFRLSRELLELLRVMAGAGIAVVPLKGPVLSQAIYESVSMRDFDDLDLLVSVDRLEAARAVLEARGYTRLTEVAPSLRSVEEGLLHHVSYQSRTARVRVELHHSLLSTASGRRYRLENLPLERSSFLGAPIDTLGPEETFVYLCQHGAAHAWARLEWLSTAAELLRSGKVRDWERVSAAARLWEGKRRVGAALGLIRELMGDRVPAALDSYHRSASAIDGVVRRLISEPARARETSTESFAFQVRTDDRLRARARRTWQVLFSPHVADLRALPLPRAATPFYALARPLRLVARRLRRRRVLR